LKVAVLLPAATITDDGTLKLPLLLDNAIVAPPVAAQVVSPTVQVTVAGGVKLEGVQLNVLKAGDDNTVTTAPLPETPTAAPVPSAP
jgi:hypothetical protein